MRFGAPAKLTENVKAWCHNAGLSGTADGHIPAGVNPLLGYAYSNEPKVNRGYWYTFLQPVIIERAP